MENSKDILNELKGLGSLLATIEKVNPFAAPVGYFNNLADTIITGIKIENKLPLAAHSNENTDVPTDYFNSLPDIILQKIKLTGDEIAVAEIRGLSPILYGMQKENVFAIPHGYFNNLGEGVLAKLKPGAKVVSLNRRRSTFIKYAVAAAFTGVMALGVFKFTGNKKSKALPEYVTAGMQINDVDGELSKISDDDIVKYLEAGGTNVKDAIVANSVDDNELPAQEDYLLDEKALENYLNSINLDNLKN